MVPQAGGNIYGTGTAIPGATRLTYTVPTNTEGTFYYYCVITADVMGEALSSESSDAVLARVTVSGGIPFQDVPVDAWYYKDVAYVYEKGLMMGTDSTTFSPAVATRRGMIVTILWRLEAEPAVSGENPFSDVAAGKYYTNAILWAATNKIVGGYGSGRFGPEDNITREQMSEIMYRYASYKGYDVTAAADLSGFRDLDQLGAWAHTAMK